MKLIFKAKGHSPLFDEYNELIRTTIQKGLVDKLYFPVSSITHSQIKEVIIVDLKETYNTYYHVYE